MVNDEVVTLSELYAAPQMAQEQGITDPVQRKIQRATAGESPDQLTGELWLPRKQLDATSALVKDIDAHLNQVRQRQG